MFPLRCGKGFEHFHDDCHRHVFEPFSLLCLIMTSLSVGSVIDTESL